MAETSSIYIQDLVKRKRSADRCARLAETCQGALQGFEEEVSTYKELRGMCQFLNNLIRSYDRDASNHCFLASHAERPDELTPIHRMIYHCLLTRDTTSERGK